MFTYLGIDECEWAIKETTAYKNFLPNMPQKNFNFYEGVNLLKIATGNVMICFFNSLNDIMENKEDLQSTLVAALKSKRNFHLVCNYTRGGNHVLAWNEECFLKHLARVLGRGFKVKKYKILGGEGIIIKGERL